MRGRAPAGERWQVHVCDCGRGVKASVHKLLSLAFPQRPLCVLFIISSILATIYTNYWGLCVDWGVLNSQFKNRWLRDKLILRNKKIYFGAIAGDSFLRLARLATLLQAQGLRHWYSLLLLLFRQENSVLRLAWLATLLQVQVSNVLNQNAFDVFMVSLEILRRGIWNFFRIGNEHLNIVGKYRAEKAIPLPFNDDM